MQNTSSTIPESKKKRKAGFGIVKSWKQNSKTKRILRSSVRAVPEHKKQMQDHRMYSTERKSIKESKQKIVMLPKRAEMYSLEYIQQVA